MIKTQPLFERLTAEEAELLDTLLYEEKGNLKVCSDRTKLNVNTLKRAKDGLTITKANAKVIRRKLLSKATA